MKNEKMVEEWHGGQQSMEQNDIAKIFSDRLSEQCLLKNIDIDELIEFFSKDFDKDWLSECFYGKVIPNDLLLVALSKYFNKSVDAFFEPGRRIKEKSALIFELRNRKIKHLENLLGKKLPYTADSFNDVLRIAVKEALDKELMSISKAASILETSIDDIRKNL